MNTGAPKDMPITATKVVRCPQKGPLGNEISVVKCVELHDANPDACGACQRFVVARIAARSLDGARDGGRG